MNDYASFNELPAYDSSSETTVELLSLLNEIVESRLDNLMETGVLVL